MVVYAFGLWPSLSNSNVGWHTAVTMDADRPEAMIAPAAPRATSRAPLSMIATTAPWRRASVANLVQSPSQPPVAMGTSRGTTAPAVASTHIEYRDGHIAKDKPLETWTDGHCCNAAEIAASGAARLGPSPKDAGCSFSRPKTTLLFDPPNLPGQLEPCLHSDVSVDRREEPVFSIVVNVFNHDFSIRRVRSKPG